MKKVILGFLLTSTILFFVAPTSSGYAGKRMIATDFEGYKFMILIGNQVLVREKTLKEMRLNDYKGYTVADAFDNETPTNVTMSGNGIIAYVSTIDNETGVNNVYRYENDKRSPTQSIWQFKDKINGLATNVNGGKLLVTTESKKLAYRSKDGGFRVIRTFAGIPTSIAMSTDGNFAFIVTGKNQLNKCVYDSANDTYTYENKELWDRPDAILGISTNMDAGKVWLITCKTHGWGYSLLEGNKDGNFKKLYDFDDTSYPWDVVLSGNSMMAYVPLSFSWIYRFAYDQDSKCYVVYKLHY